MCVSSRSRGNYSKTSLPTEIVWASELGQTKQNKESEADTTTKYLHWHSLSRSQFAQKRLQLKQHWSMLQTNKIKHVKKIPEQVLYMEEP